MSAELTTDEKINREIAERVPLMGWNELMDNITRWQRRMFPETTPESAREHLEREVAEEIKREPYDVEEWSDALFLVLQGAKLVEEIHGESILEATRKKFIKNLNRRWKKPDADGVYLHDPDHSA